MKTIIADILKKLGLKFEELTEEEKKTWEQYETVLSQPERTLDDLKGFIGSEKTKLMNSLTDYKNSKERDIYLKARYRNIEVLEAFIVSPDNQKSQLLAELRRVHNLTN
ncbi:hypothetical protein KAR28_04405 [Candidatus Parcubacteria bacterium]|nr:hypothetical protein [Candidatus Parcubacteria bacterium]